MDINEIFVGNISIIHTYNMLDYSSTFEKTIMLNNRGKINFNEIWKDKDVIMLNELAFIEKGSTITKAEVQSGDIPVVAGRKEAAYYHNMPNRNGDVINKIS